MIGSTHPPSSSLFSPLVGVFYLSRGRARKSLDNTFERRRRPTAETKRKEVFSARTKKSRRSEIVPPSPLPTAAPNRTTRKFVPPRLLSLKAAFLVRSRGSRWCRTPRCARPSQKIVSSQKHHQSPTSSHFRRVTTGTTTTSRPPRSTTFCAKPRGVFATTRTRSLRVRT